MQIRQFTQEDAAQWDIFCSTSYNATFLHSQQFISYHGTRFLDRSIILELDKKWIGILPAAESPDDTHIIISHPGISYGGFIHQGKLRGEKMIEALSLAKNFYSTLGYSKLQYKVTPYIYHSAPAQDDLYALYRLNAHRYRCDISSCIDLTGRLPVSQRRRRAHKKATKAGIELASGRKYALQLWDVLSENLLEKHDARPVHSINEILELAKRFPEAIKFMVALKDNNVIAGAVFFCNKRMIHSQYIASNKHGYSLNALDFIFESCIQQSQSKGHQFFDFGISTENQGNLLNEGLFRFKSEFGAGSVVHEFYELNLR